MIFHLYLLTVAALTGAPAPAPPPAQTQPPPQAPGPAPAPIPAPGPPPPPPTYASVVAPLLARHCIRCHSELDTNGGLRLDSYEAVLRGGDSGPAIAPGDAENSLLVQKVEHRDRPVMPPRKKITHATIAILRAWIDQGAPP